MSHIPLEDLARLPSTALVTVSPDGERLAYYSDTSGRFELYAVELRGRAVRQLTQGEAPKALRAGFVWSRDSRRIFFSRDENGDERQALFEVDLDGGRVRPLQHDPGAMDYAADVHPDGERLLVNSTRGGQMNVHEYRLGAEAPWRALTALPNATQAVAYSPSGEHIALNTNESPDLRNSDGYLLNADGGGLRRVLRVREGSKDTLGRWHPDGVRLAFSSDADGSTRVGVLHTGSGERRWLTPEGGPEETPGHFSPDGRYLSVLRNEHSAVSPVVYDLHSGEARALALPPGLALLGGWALAGEGEEPGGMALVVTLQTPTTRPQVLLYGLNSGETEVLLDAEYGNLNPADFVDATYLHYPSGDGEGAVQVPAILYRPRDLEPGRRYPALVHVHGGPTAQFFRGFDPQAQLLADRGYLVLCPNVRGSTGYGVAWRDANLLDWGGRDLSDVAAGAEYLKGLPEVDPGRLGIFGGSYGGYLSYMATVKYPELFRVGVPVVGITDLHALYRENSRVMPQLGYYFRTMMGDPEENAELWRDRSAITHAHALRAHLFMMHGTNDPRCPIGQARDFRDRLLELGRREDEHFEYVEFGDEGHGAGDIAGKVRAYGLLTDYLARRL